MLRAGANRQAQNAFDGHGMTNSGSLTVSVSRFFGPKSEASGSAWQLFFKHTANPEATHTDRQATDPDRHDR
jgi:hypothetical protein